MNNNLIYAWRKITFSKTDGQFVLPQYAIGYSGIDTKQ